jgi:hypothetical protein
LGWVDGGGKIEDMPDDVLSGELRGLLTTYAPRLWDWLRTVYDEIREDKETDKRAEVDRRIRHWVNGLRAWYNEMKMRAINRKTSKMGTWEQGPTEEGCDTCGWLNGQRHTMNWYFSKGYIPRKPGASMDCGGYECLCKIVDDDGNRLI